jgi:hypothetical protein
MGGEKLKNKKIFGNTIKQGCTLCASAEIYPA